LINIACPIQSKIFFFRFCIFVEMATQRGPQRPEKKNRTPEVCTALHVLKGAIVTVFNTPLTTAVTFNSKTAGRLAVQYEGPTPSDEQVKQVEALANKKIAEGVEVKQFTINRAEAEQKYKAQPVNGTYIYDKYASLPDDLQELSLVLIENWNINGCPGAHLAKTSDLSGIKVLRINHRSTKKELEFCVELGPVDAPSTSSSQPAASSKEKKTKGKQSQATTTSPKVINYANVDEVAQSILADVIAKLKIEFADNEQALSALRSKEEHLQKETMPSLVNTLSILRNTSYTSGFSAHLPNNK
jgi:alanyl-tRNA synthetase